MSSHSVSGLLREGRQALKEAEPFTCGLDAQILLGHILQTDRTGLLTHPDRKVEDSEACRYRSLLDERRRGKPVQYIIKHCEFMSLDFYVDESVLIPRPDTEILVEKAIAIISEAPSGTQKILELCCGSGCIAIALAHYCTDVEITAVDISKEALKIARKNAGLHRLDNKIKWLEGDLFAPIIREGYYDMILANPPYIPRSAIPDLAASVKDYEPVLALDGGFSGLDFYRRIAKESGAFLAPGGRLLFEIGYDQGPAVKAIMGNYGYENVEIEKDLAGHDRVVYSNGMTKRSANICLTD